MGHDGAREATRFLEHGRKVDALAQVIRCFDGGYGDPDPAGELETLCLPALREGLEADVLREEDAPQVASTGSAPHRHSRHGARPRRASLTPDRPPSEEPRSPR